MTKTELMRDSGLTYPAQLTSLFRKVDELAAGKFI